MALYSRQLEESWCGDEVEGSAIEFRKQAHERRGHPLRGHHFVPVEDQNGRPTGHQACWYCGKPEPRL